MPCADPLVSLVTTPLTPTASVTSTLSVPCSAIREDRNNGNGNDDSNSKGNDNDSDSDSLHVSDNNDNDNDN